jgi:hypothetical protein
VAAITTVGVHVDKLPGTANAEDYFGAVVADPTEFDATRFNENQAIRRMALQEKRFVRGIRRLGGSEKNLTALAG